MDPSRNGLPINGIDVDKLPESRPDQPSIRMTRSEGRWYLYVDHYSEYRPGEIETKLHEVMSSPDAQLRDAGEYPEFPGGV